MTATVPQPPAEHAGVEPALERERIISWKAPIAYGVLTAVAIVLFVLLARDGIANIRLSQASDFIQLPTLPLDARVTGIVVVLLLGVMTAVAIVAVRRDWNLTWGFPAVFGVAFITGFLAWAGAGSTIPIPGLLVGTVSLSVPLIFGAMGGVISERGGVVNIAIEGQLLAGAFSAAVVTSVTGNGFIGLLAAMFASILVSMVLAAFAIKYLVDQVIVGVVLNVLVAGLTSFFYSTVLTANAEALNAPERFGRIRIPILADIPLLGPMLFNQTLIVYLMYLIVPFVWWGLYHTTWGLRVRAVGEHPLAADTVGVRVNSLRFWNVTIAGAIVGIGGAYFTLDLSGSFTKEMTAGLGFIALAAVIFGQWDPLKATAAALLFGFASSLQKTLSAIGSPVPSEFMLMLPYVVTILAVAGFIGHSRAPAADGKPYVKS